MAKSILGVDLGYDRMKLALVSAGKVRKMVIAPMPDNLLRDGRITSTDTLGELMRNTLKENRIRAGDAAVTLSGEVTYLRSTSMPRMSAEQLAYNIPFEFNDYISDEPKNYLFDYAMLPPSEDPEKMELIAAAVPAAVINDLRSALRRAGLRLKKAAPVEFAYSALLTRYEAERGSAAPGEYCILDLGFRAIRMYMYRNTRHMTTRVLDTGLSILDSTISDSMGVDIHLAHTYLLKNYDNCQNSEACQNAFNNIAVELMRSFNFYRFSNPDSKLADVWLCGGGAVIDSLSNSIRETLDMSVHSAEELFEDQNVEDFSDFTQAVGIALDAK